MQIETTLEALRRAVAACIMGGETPVDVRDEVELAIAQTIGTGLAEALPGDC